MEVKLWMIGGDLNSSLFTYVDYDDVALAALICALVDLIYSFSTRAQVDYL